MPVINVTYNLPDDSTEFASAMRGADCFSVIWELDQELRSIAKHGREGFDKGTVQEIRDTLHAIADDRGIFIGEQDTSCLQSPKLSYKARICIRLGRWLLSKMNTYYPGHTHAL